MRGEYKVRGGKLVAVELEVADGVLADVHIFGDFFLESDSALETINGAAELVEQKFSTPEWTHRVP